MAAFFAYRFYKLLIVGILLGSMVGLGACAKHEPEKEDPMTLYYPAFHKESLPADFDFERTPRYDLSFQIDPEKRLLKGTQRVHFRNLSGRIMRDIYVRLYPNLPQLGGVMEVTAARTLPDGFAVGFINDVDDTAVRITLIDALQPDEDINLGIDFKVIAPNKKGYVLFGQSEGILSLPYAYPMLARQTGNPAAPWRLDVPPTFADIAITNLAFYSVTVELPSDYTVMTTGVDIADDVDSSAGITRHHFVSGPAREWSMVVSKSLRHVGQKVDGNLVNSYFLPKDEQSGKSVLAYASAVLRTYDRLFVPYAYTHLDVTEAPTRYLGMEYPKLNYIGIDTYRDVINTQEILVAHEISHQWWYALVGSDPFRYPWLDEGLAEHSSLLYMESTYGEEVANRMRSHRWRIPVKWAQDHGYDMPVGQQATAFNSTNYEILVYAKSALFFDELYQTMGRETYLKVLRTFIDRYRYKTPTPDDFLDIVREIGGIDPTPIYNKWILGVKAIPDD